MRMQRQQAVTRVFLVLAMVLASLWVGGVAFSALGSSGDQLAAARSLVQLAKLEARAPPSLQSV